MALFLQGLSLILQPVNLLLMVLGTAVGIVFGAVPGLTSVMAIALFLPMTYTMDPSLGLGILMSLYIGSVSGGLISAIILKIPGTPASIATCFDGVPMMEKGQGAKAIGIGIVFSFIGTIISILALVFIAPPLARVALSFGSHEFFALAMLSLMLIATLSSGSMVKGIFSGILGIVFSTVGIAPVDAIKRYTFGTVELNSGFQTLTVLIGLFAVTEIFKVAQSCRSAAQTEPAPVGKIRGFGFSLKEFTGQLGNGIISALTGLGIGILPGIGAGTSNMISYTLAKNRSKHPEKFGTGIIDGVVASEAANNASIGGAMIPLMTLGIPGDGVTALLLGAFMVHGISPGPLLFVSQAPLVYTIFAASFVATLLMLGLEFFGVRIFVKLLKIPKHILLPIILVLCVVGAFGLSSRMFDVWAILLFGLLGFLFVKFKVPTAPFVIGFILGGMAETNLRRALMLSDGNFMDFLNFTSHPISAGILCLTLLYLGWTIYKETRKKRAWAAAARKE